MDIDASDMAKHQRQFGLMEGRQTYNPQVLEQIHKQQQEIKTLLKEQKEVRRNLDVCKNSSRQNRDSQDTQSLRVHLEQRDKLEEETETEKQCQKELQAEISSLKAKEAEVRKGMIGVSDSQSSEVRKTLKDIHTLGNKLQRASTCFNEQVNEISVVKEDLQILHTGQARFQQLHNRLYKELQEVHKDIGEILNLSTAVYDAREEAQSKMKMRLEEAKDIAHYFTEMKERERSITNERNQMDFTSTKWFERMEEDSKHEVTPRKLSDLSEQKEAESGEEAPDALEEVFEQVQTETGEDNLDLLVSRFIQTVDETLAVIKCVNVQNNKDEAMRNQNSQIQNEIEQFQLQGSQWERHHPSLMRDVGEQQKESESQLEIYENHSEAMSKILDEIESGINSILSKMDCDRSLIEDEPGSSVGITKNNMISSLDLVSQNTNELLNVHTLLNSKDMEKDDSSTDLAMFNRGQNLDLLQQNLTGQPAANKKAKESRLTNEEEQALPEDELRRKIMNMVL